MKRRDVLKDGLAVVCAMAAGTGAFAFPAGAADSARTQATRVSTMLVQALRSIGSEPCLAAAARLEAAAHDNGAVRLHLRNAGLDSTDAATIASALMSLSDAEASFLDSFSLSYNEGLGDDGAVTVAQALPYGLRELGLVGCGIGDRGGAALLRWAHQAPRLRMMCIETNGFSNAMRTRFTELARTRAGLVVVV